MEFQIDVDAEAGKIFAGLEKVEGTDIYTPLVEKDLLCGQQQWLRVLREVANVNKDFNNLRTYIAPVSSFIGVFHYLIYPADGAMADQPLCGRVLIPKNYPIAPPVVHLFNRTNRYNVDVFRDYSRAAYLPEMESSMCFDILKTKERGGTWRPEFTLSALMASLIQAIVCINVPQTDGSEKLEYVTMESLEAVHQNVKETISLHQETMPRQRTIQKIESVPVKSKWLWFEEYISARKDKQFQIVTSEQAIQLQVKGYKKDRHVYSIGFDLSDLKSNPSTVFSIVLSNNPKDPLGERESTILVRNGVTATAAKKRLRRDMKWFYHGKPLNQGKLAAGCNDRIRPVLHELSE